MDFVLAAEPIQMGEVGLYIHIPFCDKRCTYCDFVTFTDQHSNIDRYLDALTAEMGFHRGRALSRRCSSAAELRRCCPCRTSID